MHKLGTSKRGLELYSHKGLIEKILPYGFILSGCPNEFIYGLSIDASKVNYKLGELVRVSAVKKVTGIFIQKISRLS
tara:strand:+ start:2878 stop:3108 length:231 start_codon:yes stop_codon:yes gene_type:complete